MGSIETKSLIGNRFLFISVLCAYRQIYTYTYSCIKNIKVRVYMSVCLDLWWWLTALLVQHYEGFHPDLVALNRQPTNISGCVNTWPTGSTVETLPRFAPFLFVFSNVSPPVFSVTFPFSLFYGSATVYRILYFSWSRCTFIVPLFSLYAFNPSHYNSAERNPGRISCSWYIYVWPEIATSSLARNIYVCSERDSWK